jgi:hypothetical protein
MQMEKWEVKAENLKLSSEKDESVTARDGCFFSGGLFRQEFFVRLNGMYLSYNHCLLNQ